MTHSQEYPSWSRREYVRGGERIIFYSENARTCIPSLSKKPPHFPPHPSTLLDYPSPIASISSPTLMMRSGVFRVSISRLCHSILEMHGITSSWILSHQSTLSYPILHIFLGNLQLRMTHSLNFFIIFFYLVFIIITNLGDAPPCSLNALLYFFPFFL